ncbi:serine hydrolase domain-containing protein [Pseudactinotalea suaedae]|uniref:serine hydrolase domain-containing protein n=1 Tax=Pseudactinotalea suaedae TaxID=1524924 RepID=UPI0012E1D52A|nr:serine hydrolase domain-containing protein [Pseudactinotalea suaedae]
MPTITDSLDRAAHENRFTGVVAVLGGSDELVLPYGLANRSTGTPVTRDTRFAVASGSKGMTALVIASLVEEGAVGFDTLARELLGEDLPLIDDAVTIRHLLTHTSGIGDYLDEEELDTADYVLSRPVQEYLTTSAFLPDLAGHPQAFPPGERFAYCNGGFLVLALLAERASGSMYHELVRTRVLEPAGMVASGFFRSDRLPPDTALGYLSEDEDAISNVFHLPILGNGDGGLYTTVADMHRFWTALLAGSIVTAGTVEEMIRTQVEVPDGPSDYGLGFWLRPSAEGDIDPQLVGEDAGVSFLSRHDRSEGVTRTVLSGTTEGAWEMWDTLL